MIEISFTKMHGLGNCFVLVDDRQRQVSGSVDTAELAIAACDRNFGIGADGLILLQRSATADLAMQIVNEDGSAAEMCGNGIRCFTRLAIERKMVGGPRLTVDTPAGLIRTQLLDDQRVRVDMGQPGLAGPDVIVEGEPPVHVEEQGRVFTFVSMGNPHAVTFVDDFQFDWQQVGAVVERARAFPQRVNVHFARLVSRTEAEVKVWERGCGVTLACGTGACAVAVAGAVEGRLERGPVTIALPGGPLEIEWQENNQVMMTGPAIGICSGIYCFEPLGDESRRFR